MQKDLFAAVPEFLAAYNNILENGFFEEIQFNVNGRDMEGKIYGCSISAIGCVPSKDEFKADGCGAVIDPNTVIASCRKLAHQKKIKNITTKVETKDWPVWDSKGDNIVGSKGTRTELYLYIAFNT
ncbi:MAG: hypothetical protein WA021_02530 [Minisyncoccia bacterium]